MNNPQDELAPVAGYLLGKTFPLCEPIQIVDFFVGPGGWVKALPHQEMVSVEYRRLGRDGPLCP